MKFPRQEYWSGLPLPSQGDLPKPRIEPSSPTLQADSLPSEPPGKPQTLNTTKHCGLIDIYRSLYPATAEYTFLLSSHGTPTRLDYPFGYKAHFNKSAAATAAKSLQLCPTPCDPIPGILQVRTLEWFAISFSSA